jgi:hypothetical protein
MPNSAPRTCCVIAVPTGAWSSNKARPVMMPWRCPNISRHPASSLNGGDDLKA